MNGLDITRRVLERLRRPADTALPHKTVLRTIQGVIARKKVDLLISPQNFEGSVSDWFTPTQNDFALADLGLTDILLPVRLERRGVDSDQEIGFDVPLVNFEVLNTSTVGAASFYGSPMRLALRDSSDYAAEQQYRLVYEPDFSGTAFGLGSQFALPGYFASMVELEAAWELLELVEDDTPEWKMFAGDVNKKWPLLIADWRDQWTKYTKMFKGRAQTPKRTFWQNHGRATRTRYFK